MVKTLPVIFRKWRGEICAYFPTEQGSPGHITCYAHVGQHGVADRAWLQKGKPAKPDEYAALLSELAQIYAPEYTLRVYRRADFRLKGAAHDPA